MNGTPLPPGDSDSAAARSKAESTFAWFAARHGAGEGPNFEAFLAEHPEHESELRELHAAWSQAAGAGSPLGVGKPSGEFLTPGTRVGEFRLVRCIGRGGMGEVWEAVQEPLERTVALKVLLPGRLDEKGVEFFEREARAGGKLAHPGIVAVHASGESDGVHWIAMELVPGGATLGDFLEDARGGSELPEDYYREVATLVAKVADALEAAHTAGVIHRDIKPRNVLITLEDEPKVADFGLARVVSERSLLMTGDVVGTYYYMSPEQVTAKRMGIDNRTDIFSLGVVLYELLTLTRPFEGDTTHQIAQKILLDDPPDPQQIRSRVPRDLAVICGKALEKKPDVRYPTMAELAADLRRYLAHEPIQARPPGPVERAAKWVRRNPTWSAVGAVAAAAFAAISVLLADNLRTSEALAASNDGLVQGREELAQANRDLLEKKNEAEASAVLAGEARVEAEERAEELQQVADFQAEQLSGIEVVSMGLGIRRRVLEGARAAGERAGRDPAVLEEEALVLVKGLVGTDFTGVALGALDEHVFEGALEALKGFEDQPLVQAQLLQTLGSTLRELGLLDRALEPQEQALEIRRSELGDEHLDTLISISNLGLLIEAQGKYDHAETLFREALEATRRTLGDEHRDTLASISNLGNLLRDQGKYDDAESLYREGLETTRRALGDEHPGTLTSINNLGSLLRAQGKLDDAEPLLREALEVRRRTLGDEHPSTLISIGNLGNLLRAQGKLDDADPLFREVLEVHRRTLGDEHPNTLKSINHLGGFFYAQGKLDDAESLFREVLEIRSRTLGDEHPSTLISSSNLGGLLLAQGKLDDAEPLFRKALEVRRRTLGDEHPGTLTSINNLGALFYAQGKYDDAEALCREALEGFRRALGDEHRYTRATKNRLEALISERRESKTPPTGEEDG